MVLILCWCLLILMVMVFLEMLYILVWNMLYKLIIFVRCARELTILMSMSSRFVNGVIVIFLVEMM